MSLGILSALAACDFYEEKINDDWSLCAVDISDAMTLCRNLGDGSFHQVLEPTMVSYGYNGSVISLRRCFERNEEYYSVDATHTGIYTDPPYIGPLTYSEWEAEFSDDPENWPQFSFHYKWLAEKHCPRTE